MHFTKMQALGNDYIYINCLAQEVENPSALSIRLSDRHFGIGSDGLILIKPSGDADFAIEIYNADGSRAQMCGNGIRCVGKYLYEKGLTAKTSLQIATDAGIRKLHLEIEGRAVRSVSVSMGAPVFDPARIPLKGVTEPVIERALPFSIGEYTVTCLSMGNPHCVLFFEEALPERIRAIGPAIENDPLFPQRTNVEFARQTGSASIQMRVWERGAGETLACGTGACAAVAAGVKVGRLPPGDEVAVQMPGGELRVRYAPGCDTVWMKGEAAFVFEGDLPFS